MQPNLERRPSEQPASQEPRVLKDQETSVFLKADHVMAKAFGVPVGADIPMDAITSEKSEELEAAYQARQTELVKVLRAAGDLLASPATSIVEVEKFLRGHDVTVQEIKASAELFNLLQGQVPNFNEVIRLLDTMEKILVKKEGPAETGAEITVADEDIVEVSGQSEAEAA